MQLLATSEASMTGKGVPTHLLHKVRGDLGHDHQPELLVVLDLLLGPGCSGDGAVVANAKLEQSQDGGLFWEM